MSGFQKHIVELERYYPKNMVKVDKVHYMLMYSLMSATVVWSDKKFGSSYAAAGYTTV